MDVPELLVRSLEKIVGEDDEIRNLAWEIYTKGSAWFTRDDQELGTLEL